MRLASPRSAYKAVRSHIPGGCAESEERRTAPPFHAAPGQSWGHLRRSNADVSNERADLPHFNPSPVGAARRAAARVFPPPHGARPKRHAPTPRTHPGTWAERVFEQPPTGPQPKPKPPKLRKPQTSEAPNFGSQNPRRRNQTFLRIRPGTRSRNRSSRRRSDCRT
jgi:hypothetical protein